MEILSAIAKVRFVDGANLLGRMRIYKVISSIRSMGSRSWTNQADLRFIIEGGLRLTRPSDIEIIEDHFARAAGRWLHQLYFDEICSFPQRSSLDFEA